MGVFFLFLSFLRFAESSKGFKFPFIRSDEYWRFYLKYLKLGKCGPKCHMSFQNNSEEKIIISYPTLGLSMNGIVCMKPSFPLNSYCLVWTHGWFVHTFALQWLAESVVLLLCEVSKSPSHAEECYHVTGQRGKKWNGNKGICTRYPRIVRLLGSIWNLQWAQVL